METRRIASLEVTLTGLGCNNFGWRIDAAASAQVVARGARRRHQLLRHGRYLRPGRSEEFLGRALRAGGARSDRDQVRHEDGRHWRGREARVCSAGRRVQPAAAGIEQIDLYQLHRPDPNTPIADTLGALNDLVREGKVREIGCSNFSVEQMREAEKAAGAGARFVSVQNEYSLFHREPEQGVLAECERQGLAFLPFFPLANGLLTGKYRAGQEPPAGSRGAVGFGPKVFTTENLAKAEKLAEFAESRGHTLLELAFSWLASHSR